MRTFIAGMILIGGLGWFEGPRQMQLEEEAIYVADMQSRVVDSRANVRRLLHLYDQLEGVSVQLLEAYATGGMDDSARHLMTEVLEAEIEVFDDLLAPPPVPDGYRWVSDELKQEYMRAHRENDRLCRKLNPLRNSAESTLMVLSDSGGGYG